METFTILEALPQDEQGLFTLSSPQKYFRVSAYKTLFFQIQPSFELLEYISPKSLETLESTLKSHKDKTLELNKIIRNL